MVRCLSLALLLYAVAVSAGEPQVVLGTTTFTVTVAATEEARARGLSGSESLAADRGMLFIFEREEQPSIWMRGMRFPLDIIWINRSGLVVHIKRNIHPDTYPKQFTTVKPARYVLEISAGAGKEVAVGDAAFFRGGALD